MSAPIELANGREPYSGDTPGGPLRHILFIALIVTAWAFSSRRLPRSNAPCRTLEPTCIRRTCSFEQVARGLSGTLIVEEADAPEVDLDGVLVLDDWLLNPENARFMEPFVPPMSRSH